MKKVKLNYSQNKKGFTIIEVVLVLAIAGLIFLMVFIALPALQRNQRDTQRKNDLNRELTAVRNYQANNKNQVVDQIVWRAYTSMFTANLCVPDCTEINNRYTRDILKII